jgi:serine/threonine protein kinase
MRPERTVEMGRGIESSFQTGDLTPNPQQAYTTQESGPSMSRDQSVAFCLGQQPHPMRAEEVICRHCGSLVAGTRLGVYQVQRQLGRGRNGSAYLATHVRSQQPVTIKMQPADASSASLWEAARKEVRTITSLRHPTILPVFSCTAWHPDLSASNSRPLHELMTAYPAQETYLLTLRQYVPVTLSQYAAHYERSEMNLALRRRGVEPLGHLLRLLQQIGAALEVAHARGLVHGGVMPGNVLVDSHEHLWLSDFGLTRLLPPKGTYLAPELQIVGTACLQAGNMAPYWNAVTPASDQYMLGILCQQLFARLLQTAEFEHLQPVLQCATQMLPSQRFGSVDQFMHELIMRAGQTTLSHERHTSSFEQQRLLSMPGHKVVSPTPVLPEVSSSNHTSSSNHALNYNLAASAPASPADDWEKLGGKLFTSHDYHGAVKAYIQALELAAQKATLWLALGDAYFALENYAEALTSYEQAIQRNPNDPLAWSNRGTALDALGRHKEAEECYERADQLQG